MPAPVVPRLISVTYAGLTVGGSSNYQITGYHDLEKEYGQLTVELDVVVRDTTTAGCKTLADALELAWSTPDQDLTVTIDGENFVAVTQSGHTGMNARPSCRMTGLARTKKSRTYRCSVTLLRPATLAGKDGRQSASRTITTDAIGRRRVTIRATYTALPGVGAASTVVDTYFEDWAETVRTAIDPTVEWEPEGTELEPDDNDKVATIVGVWRELTFDQSARGRDDVALVDPQYDVSTFRTATPQFVGSNASEPVSVAIAFSTGFKLSEVQPEEIRQAVEDLVVAYFAELLDVGSDAPSAPIPIEKNVKVDPIKNTATGVVTYVAFETSLVRCSLRIQDYEYTGNALVAVMDGKPHSRDLHPSPGLRRRVLTYTAVELGDGTGDLALRPLQAAKRAAVAANYWLIDEQKDGEAFERRLPGGNESVQFFERAHVVTLDYAEISSGGATTASGAGQQLTSQVRA